MNKGDILAKVNDAPLQAQLRKLEVQLQLAEDRVYRQNALLEKEAVSKEAYEQVQTDLATLQAEIDIVKANIALTELKAHLNKNHSPENRIFHSRSICRKHQKRRTNRVLGRRIYETVQSSRLRQRFKTRRRYAHILSESPLSQY